MVDDNKELVFKLAQAMYAIDPDYRHDTMESMVVAPFGYNERKKDYLLSYAQAALSIIQPELQKRDEEIERLKAMTTRKILIALNEALKITTGHDSNNHKPQGELK